jgi:hypothetical protein
MPRQPLAQFGEGTEVVRVYLAVELAEAQRAEEALDGAGLAFAVEVEELGTRSFFGLGRPRRAAGLWILEAELDRACRALERSGLVKGLVDRG